jgi:hypothetical protein
LAILSFMCRHRRREMLMLLGVFLNAAAVASNGGHMPVLGLESAYGIWVPLTPSSHLRWACDIYASFSIGDMLIGANLAWRTVLWLHRPRGLKRSDYCIPCWRKKYAF